MKQFFCCNIRSCSYGGELARLGVLACLCEISPSLRNSYENINVFMRKAIQISLDFAEIPPRRDENYVHVPYEHAQLASPASWGRVFLNQLCFVFQMLIK